MFHNNFNPSQMVCSSPIITNKKLLPSVSQIYKFTATPTCYNAKQSHLSPSKITFTHKNLPVGTEVHTAQTCHSRQNRSSRELLMYNARSFIILLKCWTPPHSLTITFTSFHML